MIINLTYATDVLFSFRTVYVFSWFQNRQQELLVGVYLDGTPKTNRKQKHHSVSKRVRLKISSSEKNLAASATPEQLPTNHNEPKPLANLCCAH